ncbi:expressed protein, partial [Phakopsora pachyrhizi]
MSPAWSREKSDRKLSLWAKKQDFATVEKELANTAKDLRRNGSVSLDPDYIVKRQAERERARDAAHRLSSIGLRIQLDPLVVQQPPPPSPPSLPPPKPSRSVKKVPPITNEDNVLMRSLHAEVERLRARGHELESALTESETRREEERKIHEREKKLMLTTIKKLKAEVDEGWNRIIRLRECYGGIDLSHATTKNPGIIYEEEEGFERVHRPPSRVSFRGDQLKTKNLHPDDVSQRSDIVYRSQPSSPNRVAFQGSDQLRLKSLHPDDLQRRSDLVYRSQPSSPNRLAPPSHHQRVSSVDNPRATQGCYSSNLAYNNKNNTPPRRSRRISF